MTGTNYIPPKNADFQTWLDNLAAVITANPTDFGLTAPDAVAISAQATACDNAYAIAQNPSTRTSVTVIDYNNARATAEATVRPYCVSISLNSGVTDANKLTAGVTVRKTVPTPVPPPITFPQLALLSATPLVMQFQYRDSATPTSKSKPAGVIGVQVFKAVGTVAATDPSQCVYDQTWTKSPNTLTFDPAQQGKIVTFAVRYVTRGGPAGTQQNGPWAPLQSYTIM